MLSFSIFVRLRLTLFAFGFFLFDESWKINSFSPVWKNPFRHLSVAFCFGVWWGRRNGVVSWRNVISPIVSDV